MIIHFDKRTGNPILSKGFKPVYIPLVKRFYEWPGMIWETIPVPMEEGEMLGLQFSDLALKKGVGIECFLSKGNAESFVELLAQYTPMTPPPAVKKFLIPPREMFSLTSIVKYIGGGKVEACGLTGALASRVIRPRDRWLNPIRRLCCVQ